MELDVRPDMVFLAIEAAGVSLTGILLGLLGRETGRAFVRWWAAGWMSLAVSIVSLLVQQAGIGAPRAFLLLHLVGGYAFAVLTARGFGAFRGDARGWRRELVLACVLGAWAAGLLTFAGDDGWILHAHAVALGFLLLITFDESRRAHAPGSHRIGRWASLIALLVLALNLAGFGLLGWFGAWGASAMQVLRPVKALVDLILLTALGFGQALLVMETVIAELARSNEELEATRDRLEVQARVDPLTSALNRHAFHSMLSERADTLPQRAGCVVVIDIDRLKDVNDTRGHAAGDQLIRAAAATIRRVVRADDLLFRWGGDEFLAILFGLSKAGADERLRTLRERRAGAPEAPSLSWGIAPFEGPQQLGEAIEAADREMYAGRARRRGQGTRAD